MLIIIILLILMLTSIVISSIALDRATSNNMNKIRTKASNTMNDDNIDNTKNNNDINIIHRDQNNTELSYAVNDGIIKQYKHTHHFDYGLHNVKIVCKLDRNIISEYIICNLNVAGEPHNDVLIYHYDIKNILVFVTKPGDDIILNYFTDKSYDNIINISCTKFNENYYKKAMHPIEIISKFEDNIDNLFKNAYGLLKIKQLYDNDCTISEYEYNNEINYQPFIKECSYYANSEEKVFNDFRNNKWIVDMLEHVPEHMGKLYFEMIKNITNDLNICIEWTDISKNDLVGSPRMTQRYTHNQQNIDYSFDICSTTMRYVFFALKILMHIKSNLSNDNNNVDIIEIGGGYGGQCSILFKMSIYFDIKINSYSIFDLSEPHQLQKRYLKTQLVDNIFSKIQWLQTTDNIKEILKSDSFLLSAYAYSEISPEVQIIYDELLSGYISHGYILWNSSRLPSETFYKMINHTLKDISIEREYPTTGLSNCLLTF